MIIFISIVKIFIAFVFGYIILCICERQDTSTVQTLVVKSKGIVTRIFSPKQLGEIEISFKKLSIPYNTLTVFGLVVLGVTISIISFFICENIFPLTSISLILACPLALSPFWIVKYIANMEQNKLESGLNDFFIQLKSALKVNTDIIEALRRVQNTALAPFSQYVRQLLTEINAGKIPENALEGFAQKVNIKRFSHYMNNVRYCHIYGGEISVLTEKTQEILADTLKQKKKRIKETKSICTVLYILILIDIYMYFVFIEGNQYYLDIMINSFIGRTILNMNFLSIWGIIWLSRIVRKFDY